ncbi:MAG TPA: Wzz/FepE/Etk N-terminal domain-containing protein [Ignavibacteriaceae bacterium]|nr:Wzz/FepE/Etk N-terminal domain-containing protein [Ignavibacteriaceae bacterium]
MNNNLEGKNNFFEFVTITVKYRWFLFFFILIVTVSITSYALLSPKWYKSTASVLPAEKTDFLSAITGVSSLIKNFSPSKGLSALTGPTETDKYIAILKSASVINDVIKTFNIKKVYDLEDAYGEKIYKRLMSNLEIEVQEEGNLTISVYDKDPKRAAEIANFMVSKLNEISTKLSSANANANRVFIEKRYIQNKQDITDLENQMKDFQKKYGVTAVPEQIEATLKSMSEVYVDLYKKEIQYNILQQSMGEDHPLTKNAKIEMEELNKKIKKLNEGNDKSEQDIKLLIPMKLAPDLANKYLKIYQELKIQYSILEFVTPLYEQAKIEEVRNTPTVLVLDEAFPADHKAKPKAMIYAAVSFTSSIVLGFVIIFLLELIRKMKIVEPNKYKYITEQLRKDLSKIGIKRKS